MSTDRFPRALDFSAPEDYNERVTEVPESDTTVCWETELVRGYEAQGSQKCPSLLLICGQSCTDVIVSCHEDVSKMIPPKQCPDLDGLHFLCLDSDWQCSQTFHPIEQRRRRDFWFQSAVLTRLRVVTENR